MLLRNEGIGPDGVPRFANVAMAVGADDIKDGRGVAYGDFDNDGDLDIVMNTNPGDCGHISAAPVLLRNDLGQSRNWLAVELVGTRCNRDAIGAEVYITLCGGAGGQAITGDAPPHGRLGIRLAERPPTPIRAGGRPPGRHHADGSLARSREEQTFENIPANRWVRIREGGGLETSTRAVHRTSQNRLTSRAPSRGKP